MIQLYNVPATNRLNLLANSTPQKTITVVEASLKVVIMLPFRVPGLASQLRQEKWEIFLIFFPLLCFQLTQLSGNLNCQNGKTLRHEREEGRVRLGE